MTKGTAFIVPYSLNFGSSFCGTPSRTREGILETLWQSKACTIGEIYFCKVGKKSIIADVVEHLDFCKDLTNHILKKGKGLLVHPLMNGFRRDCHILAQLCDLRRQLCQRRFGLAPGPKGHEGQEEFARNLRRAFDKASATGCSFDVVGRKEVC